MPASFSSIITELEKISVLRTNFGICKPDGVSHTTIACFEKMLQKIKINVINWGIGCIGSCNQCHLSMMPHDNVLYWICRWEAGQVVELKQQVPWCRTFWILHCPYNLCIMMMIVKGFLLLSYCSHWTLCSSITSVSHHSSVSVKDLHKLPQIQKDHQPFIHLQTYQLVLALSLRINSRECIDLIVVWTLIKISGE